jgi:hypothetical protein
VQNLGAARNRLPASQTPRPALPQHKVAPRIAAQAKTLPSRANARRCDPAANAATVMAGERTTTAAAISGDPYPATVTAQGATGVTDWSPIGHRIRMMRRHGSERQSTSVRVCPGQAAFPVPGRNGSASRTCYWNPCWESHPSGVRIPHPPPPKHRLTCTNAPAATVGAFPCRGPQRRPWTQDGHARQSVGQASSVEGSRESGVTG